MALLLSSVGIATWMHFQTTHAHTYIYISIESELAQPDNPSYLIILHFWRAITKIPKNVPTIGKGRGTDKEMEKHSNIILFPSFADLQC